MGEVPGTTQLVDQCWILRAPPSQLKTYELPGALAWLFPPSLGMTIFIQEQSSRGSFGVLEEKLFSMLCGLFLQKQDCLKLKAED